MSERSLRMVLAILAVALLAFAVRQWSGRASGGPEARALEGVLARLDGRDVVRFQVSRRTEQYDLEKTAAGWQVNGLPADTVVIDRLWVDLTAAVPLEVTARNPANHGRLGVADDSTVVLTVVHTDGTESRLFVGRPGPQQPSGYVRLPGSDEVYLVKGEFFEAMRQPLVYWRDLLVMKIDTSAVETVVVSYGDDSFRLRRAPPQWTVDGALANAEAVGELLTALNRQYAVGFSRDSTGYGPDRRGLVALDSRGDTLVSLAMRAGQRGEPLVTMRGSSFIFELDRHSLERLMPPRSRLRAVAPPAGRPAGSEGVRPSVALR
ncbi:MAG: DUF4340 domain-containing protein [Gemmatimonadales bacterium]